LTHHFKYFNPYAGLLKHDASNSGLSPTLCFDGNKNTSWEFICIAKGNIFPRGIKMGILSEGGKYLHKTSGG
jgi:hypothetical protein